MLESGTVDCASFWSFNCNTHLAKDETPDHLVFAAMPLGDTWGDADLVPVFEYLGLKGGSLCF